MIELLLNELLSTFPFHFLAYIPFYKRLKYSPLETVLRVCMCQIFYLGIFTILTLAGFSSVWVQYLAVPIFGVLFCLLVQADRGMILFFYMFILDYLLVIRAAAFCICEKLFGFNFFSWQSGFITLFLILCTILLMVKAMSHITKGLCSVSVPSFWRTAWLLPCSVTLILLLLTGDIRSGTVTISALLARILLLICMFLISHFMILFIQQLKEQLETNTRNQAMERLLQIQHDQYSMLQARIAENRRARHDFRQHLRVIQDCVKRGDLEDLKSYLAEYEKQFPSHSDHIYCNSYAVNAILAFYADKAENHNIRLDVKIQMSDTPVIPETEFCVLLGNLLENALDACQTGHPESETSQPFIRVCAIQTGTSTLSITVDNTSVFKPTWINEKLVSTKAAGSGIGTESIRMIAEQYRGDARFEWKDGVFYASVMLNP
ncbi:MAG: GHKL domain-containing protein [Lachnospiraceae bacterium]